MRSQPGQHKDARADDGAYAQRGERNRTQGAPQRMLAGRLGFLQQQIHRLLC